MKKSLLLVPLVLGAITLPARAIDEAEAFYYGQRETELLCEAIWQGAPSLPAAYQRIHQNRYFLDRATLIGKIEQARGENDPIIKAYNAGVRKSIMQCLPEIQKLTGK